MQIRLQGWLCVGWSSAQGLAGDILSSVVTAISESCLVAPQVSPELEEVPPPLPKDGPSSPQPCTPWVA